MTKETRPLIQYLLLFTILFSLFSLQQIVPMIYLNYYYWLIAFSTILFGLSMVMINLGETLYEWGTVKKNFNSWFTLVIHIFGSVIGFVVISLGIYFALILAKVINAPIV